MVKTRHSGGIDAESPPTFISLTNEKSRQSLRSNEPACVGGQPERTYGESRDAYNIFEEKVVESRLRPRIGPSRAYNYIDVDSSEEEIIRRGHRHLPIQEFSSERRRSRYCRSREVKQDILDKEEGPRRMLRRQSSHHEYREVQSTEEEEEEEDNRCDRTRRQRCSSRVHEAESNEKSNRSNSSRHLQLALEEQNESSRKSLRKRQQQSAEDEDEENARNLQQHPTAEEDDEHLIRRSSRTRRQVYDTLNQSYLVSIPGRSRHDSGDNNSDMKDQDSDDNQEFSDMYSRVKRKRVQVKRNMYSVPVSDDSDSEQDVTERNKSNNNKHDDDVENSEDDAEENIKDEDNTSKRVTRQQNHSPHKKQPEIIKSYSLREHKPRTDLYKAPVEERRIKRIHGTIFPGTSKKSASQAYHSPAQKRNVRKRSAFHSSSSSTSSDSESSDEKSFNRRKAKSLKKARSRIMPLDFNSSALPRIDRIKSGTSLADIEPMNIDRSVTFNSIGGLGKHIRALKEMIVFPLLYDQVFQRFKVDPPRGVLFYGPPGTGKTLVARALANECSQGDKRVHFFFCKGADCLSKWVGESERQLRLLFDQAYRLRPSIIFFDEIDGLAPVRSSRQDQIHSSIVSTLLALMDGLDSRGEIVVIGATNRIDSIDPALRRPGRFDREFLFHLPSLEARKQILKIHTAGWTPKLNDDFISELAEKCVGYCGADLKALCTEAAMLALRRRYPQIYITNEALQLDVSSINVSAKDFFDAVNSIIPTSQRAVSTPARALPARVSPLLQRLLDRVLHQLSDIFPPCFEQTTTSFDASVTSSQVQALAENGFIWDELASDEDENAPSIYIQTTSGKGKGKAIRRSTEEQPSTSKASSPYLAFASSATCRPATFRPRLILVGREGQGQTTYIAPAIIHKMENLPVHVLDLPTLYAVTAKTPEESCASVFHEAKRKCPSIIYMPYINQWWDVMGETLKAALLTLMQNLDPSLPLLLLATSEQPYYSLDPVLQSLFSQVSGEVVHMTDPNMEERRAFFKDLLLRQAIQPPPQKKQAGEILEFLRTESEIKRTCRRSSTCSETMCVSSATDTDDAAGTSDEIEETFLTNSNVLNTPVRTATTSNGKRKRTTSSPSPNLTTSAAKKKRTSQATVKHTRKAVAKKSTKSTGGRSVRSQITNARLKTNYSAKGTRKPVAKRSTKSTFGMPLRPRTNNDARRSTNHSAKGTRKTVAKSSRKSTFGMSLRSRTINARLNTNQSAKLSELLFEPLIYKSSKPTASHNDSFNNQVCPTSVIALHKWAETDISNPRLCGGSQQMLYKTWVFQRQNLSQTYSTRLILPLNLQDLCPKLCSCHKCIRHRISVKSLPSARSYMKIQCCSQCFLWSRQRWRHEGTVIAQRMLEVLPKAAPPKPRELTEEELTLLVEKEELTLMELRIFLRDVINKLGNDKKFSIFAKPVNIEDAADYYDIIERPMDLSTMMAKIDLHEYTTVRAFMQDIDLICSNALEYNPNRGSMDRIIRHRACALKDTAYAIIKTDLDKDFEKTCVEIEESRKRRGEKSTTVPNFYYTQPASQQQPSSKSQAIPSYLENPKPVRSIPKPEGERFSRRVRGMNIDPVPPLEAVEKVYRLSRVGALPSQENKDNPDSEFGSTVSQQQDSSMPDEEKSDHIYTCSSSQLSSVNSLSKEARVVDNADVKTDEEKKTVSVSTSLSSKRKKSTCVWCKPRRKRPKFSIAKLSTNRVSGDEGAEDEMSHEEMDGEKLEHGSQKEEFQQLVVDTTEQEAESIHMKNLEKMSTKCRSPAHVSPVSNCTSRVSTRRSSLSPNTMPVTHRSHSNQPQVNAEQTESKKDRESSILEQCLPSESKGENKDKIIIDSIGNTSHQSESFGQTTSLLKEPIGKPKVVKRLDLESVTVDSGVGSSVDSNGDSRDSLDHRGEGEAGVRTSSLFPGAEDSNQNCNRELSNSASEILNKPTQKVVVDNNRLMSLLTRLVARTDGYTVERLEKIYSHLSQIVFRHRHEYDKSAMIADLAQKIDELTQIVPFTGMPSTVKSHSSTDSAA